MKITFRAIFTLATVVLVAAAPGAAAQPAPKLPRVAYVWLFSEGPSGPYSESFRDRMGQLGWIDGKNFVLEHRDAHGNPAELDATSSGWAYDPVARFLHVKFSHPGGATTVTH